MSSPDQLPTLPYRPSRDQDSLWDRELSSEQLSWRSETVDDVWELALPWRCERTVNELDGQEVEVVMLTNGAGPQWDWRTVAFWSHALGGEWKIHLRNGGRLDLLRTRRAHIALAEDNGPST